MTTTYYELRRAQIKPPAPGEFPMASAAAIVCSLCGTYIDGSGGPGDGPLCVPCGDLLRHGRLRGVVTWADDGQSREDDDGL